MKKLNTNDINVDIGATLGNGKDELLKSLVL